MRLMRVRVPLRVPERHCSCKIAPGRAAPQAYPVDVDIVGGSILKDLLAKTVIELDSFVGSSRCSYPV